ncbi:HD domain-containing protein [Clostridium sp. WB02_MRS01]|uniref:HD domain-containing protein n=1 Tax=Clostridium sp. WB02_MRS01 TaxID=2605777 RepID=UPI00256FE9F0|nr:HD domain-containing protein [Clostridium sp. WB02_MRS01]
MNKQHGFGSADRMPREYLEDILLSDKEIQLLEDELFTISPELIVCKNCEQNMPAHRVPVLAHTYEVVNGVRKDITLKLAALLHDIGKPYTKRTINGVDSFKGHEKISELLAGLILQRLGFEDNIRQDVCLLIRYHDFDLTPTKESIDDITQKVGAKLVLPLLELQLSDLFAHSEQKVNEFISIRESTLKYYLNYSES